MARGALRRGRRGQASLLQTGSLAPTCAFAVDAWGKAWQDGDVRPVVLVGVCSLPPPPPPLVLGGHAASLTPY